MFHSIPDDSVILLENEFLIFEIVNLLHVKREMPVILHMKRDPNPPVYYPPPSLQTLYSIALLGRYMLKSGCSSSLVLSRSAFSACFGYRAGHREKIIFINGLWMVFKDLSCILST